MTSIDEILARALLLDEPPAHPDIVPLRLSPTAPPDPDDLLPPAPGTCCRRPARCGAARDLLAICEAVVTHSAASALRDFVTEQLPEPSGARVLGCVLQLTDTDDGARFWWQYAAGAGDVAASYCLYLHHLALGESDAAEWWRAQTPIDTEPGPQPAATVTLPGCPEEIAGFDSSTPTVLRVLTRLLSGVSRPRADIVNAMIDYVPGAVAVGYVDHPDFDIPLPGPDFAKEIAMLLDVATTFAARAGDRPAAGTVGRGSRLEPRPVARPEHAWAAPPAADEEARDSHRCG